MQRGGLLGGRRECSDTDRQGLTVKSVCNTTLKPREVRETSTENNERGSALLEVEGKCFRKLGVEGVVEGGGQQSAGRGRVITRLLKSCGGGRGVELLLGE